MWGEWIPTNGNMHYQTFPRIAAYAEIGWTSLENKDFEKFKKALENLYQKWSKQEIYAAPKAYIQRR